MFTTSARYQQIATSLRDKEYRDIFVEEHISTGLSFQIRAMREQRGWTQEDLGQRAGMAQQRVCQLENPNYGRFSLSTLKRLASAFDVALAVHF
ncbi:MAG: helix-turn-helix transcriptional regulator, partial [Chloroflexi bacterium]|nr:helix-turn-helix transcriptional regulator [Chloroflexota bacterium]